LSKRFEVHENPNSKNDLLNTPGSYIGNKISELVGNYSNSHPNVAINDVEKLNTKWVELAFNA
jgi:hypothetical protein